jgi:hypothetical protein
MSQCSEARVGINRAVVGSALARGRMQVDDFDLVLVGHVAMSSAGNNLPRILRGVLTRNVAASTPELVADSGSRIQRSATTRDSSENEA